MADQIVNYCRELIGDGGASEEQRFDGGQWETGCDTRITEIYKQFVG